nr:LuxR C-terminal-related transcriptional regulator [Nocardia coffeae]
MSRNTVRRALTFAQPPQDHRPRRGSSADELAPAVASLLDEDPEISIAEIQRRVGWSRSRNTLAKLVHRLREDLSSSPESFEGKPFATPQIPTFATSFIGRDRELTALRTLLGEKRLITISGPGGIGKTRLAVEAASEFRRAFPDGVRFVEIASLHSPTLMPQTVVDGLGIASRDRPEQSTDDVVIEFLRHKQILIVLDNCEHMIDACARLVSKILRYTTRATIVVTSRETLSIPEEHVFAVPSLPTIREESARAVGAAMELFENRAAAVLSGFAITESNNEVVRRICTQLDGIPLAIELACARLTALSVQDLADRLDHRLDILTVGNRGGPTRHQSLQATVDWSYELCTPNQQQLWARLSVFAGVFDLSMAEQVCGDDDVVPGEILDAIAGLVSKSVLRREESLGRVRFRMLETIREYGAGKLTSADAEKMRTRHLRWCSDLVRAASEAWTGHEQQAAADSLRGNRANLRLALQTAFSNPTPQMIDAAAEIASTWFLWSSAFSVREHRLWLTRIAEIDRAPSVRRSRVLATLGIVLTMQGDRAAANEALDEALLLAGPRHDEATVAFATQSKGLCTYLGGEFESAQNLLLDALHRYEHLPGRTDLLWTLHIEMGMFYSSTLDTARAIEHFDFVRHQAEQSRERWMLSYAIYGSGLVALVNEQYTDALRYALESLTLKRAFDDVVGTTLVTDLLGWAEAAAGSAERSAVLIGAASELWSSFGMQLYGSAHWVQLRARFESSALAAIGDRRYLDCQRRGAAMSLPDLVEYALDELGQNVVEGESKPVVTSTLTQRESEVARLVAQGLSNKEIAARLVISHRTVEGHVERVLRKLGLIRRHQIATALG